MQKFTLINKTKSRIKVFEPFEDSSKNFSMINSTLISYGLIVSFLRDQVSELWKARGLNLSKKRETNIKNFYRKDGKKLIDSIVFSKKIGNRYFT